VATILDLEADIVAHSYDTTIGRTDAQRHKSPVIEDATERRRFREYRRLASELRAAAECTYKPKPPRTRKR
jgi:hypothetical protein